MFLLPSVTVFNLKFGDESVSFDVFAPWFVLKFTGVVDVYPRRGNYVEIGESGIFFEKEFFSAHEVASVEAFVKKERFRKFAGAVREIGFLDDPFAVRPDQIESFDRLDCADKDSLRIVFRRGNDIEAEVHPVNHVDVGVSARQKHRLGPFGAPSSESVTAFVKNAAVSLGFDDFCDDSAGSGLSHKKVAEQIFRDAESASHEKRAWKTHENSVKTNR